MPIDVNSYNAQFSQFVQFAERQMQAGKAKAFASLGAEGATGLATRDIKPGSGDSVQRRCDFRSRHSRRSHELTFNQQTLRRIKHGYKG